MSKIPSFYVIPDEVKSLDRYNDENMKELYIQFNKNLKKITRWPANVTSIKIIACPSLATIPDVFPPKLKHLALIDTKLSHLVIPDGLVTLGLGVREISLIMPANTHNLKKVILSGSNIMLPLSTKFVGKI